MFSQSIADLALILLQLGFAAVLASFAHKANSWLHRVLFALALLIYIAASFVMPLAWPVNVISGVASVLAFTFAFLQPAKAGWHPKANLPKANLPKAAWWYAGFAMLTIVSWSAAQGWFSPVIFLGVTAALAAGLSWRRGFSADG
jgi:hypothetical protein